MQDIVWIIVRRHNRLLLVKRVVKDHNQTLWTFPGGTVNNFDQNHAIEIHRMLENKTGLDVSKFRLVSNIKSQNTIIHTLYCDEYKGGLSVCNNNIVGLGWFSISEIYSLGNELCKHVSNNMAYLSYLIQHYDNHPDEWKEKWVKCDENE